MRCADLLLGLPVLTGGARLDNPQNLRAQTWSAFAHDDWRARPSLTISAGLRYDYVAPAVDSDDRANLYDVATGQLVPVGTAGMPRGGYEADRNNLAPRAGFAWTVDRVRPHRPAGRLRDLLQPGRAGDVAKGCTSTRRTSTSRVYFPDPRLPLLTLDDPFPSSFPVFIPQSATAYQRDLQTPWMEHWNLNVQRQVRHRRARSRSPTSVRAGTT